MTAALDNDNYCSRLNVSSNAAQTAIIDRLIAEAAGGPSGPYKIEWKIKDGVIQDITLESPFTDKPIFSQLKCTPSFNVQELHKQTLVGNWHGRVVVNVESNYHGNRVLSATKIQSFRPGT